MQLKIEIDFLSSSKEGWAFVEPSARNCARSPLTERAAHYCEVKKLSAMVDIDIDISSATTIITLMSSPDLFWYSAPPRLNHGVKNWPDYKHKDCFI